MAGRIRTIKPEWLEDERLAAASDVARLMSVALIVLADDFGNGRANPGLLAAHTWPYGNSHETIGKAASSVAELAAGGFVEVYEVAGQRYYHIRNWDKHQRVQHPGNPRVPNLSDGIRIPPETLMRPSGDSHESLAPYLRSGSPIADLLYPASAGSEPGGSGVPPRFEQSSPTSAPTAPAPVAHPSRDATAENPESGPPPSPQLALVPDSPPKGPSAAERVFAAYLAGWHRVIKGTRPPKLDDKRQRLIRARVRDGFTVDDLEAAARGVWLDKWSIEDPAKRISFEITLRDSAHVEKFREIAGNPALGADVKSSKTGNRQPLPEAQPDFDFKAHFDKLKERRPEADQ